MFLYVFFQPVLEKLSQLSKVEMVGSKTLKCLEMIVKKNLNMKKCQVLTMNKLILMIHLFKDNCMKLRLKENKINKIY